MNNLRLTLVTLKWLALMIVLAISFYMFGDEVVEAVFGVRLSPYSKNVILGIMIIMPYLLGAREILAELRKRKQGADPRKRGQTTNSPRDDKEPG